MEKNMQEQAPPYFAPPMGGAAYPPPPFQTGPQPGMYPSDQYSSDVPIYSQPGMYPSAPFDSQPGMYPSAPVVNQTVVLQPTQLRDAAGLSTCPNCQKQVLTQTQHTNGMLTWLYCALCGLFLCWICCCIPFCVNATKDVEHRCPDCQRVIYIYRRL